MPDFPARERLRLVPVLNDIVQVGFDDGGERLTNKRGLALVKKYIPVLSSPEPISTPSGQRTRIQ